MNDRPTRHDRRPSSGATADATGSDASSMDLDRRRIDGVVAVAWLIVANKPFFPLWIWWFVGNGTAAAFLTVWSMPAFLAIAMAGRRHSLAARVALPLLGAVDTVVATKLFGAASGAELFFVPCLLLAVVGFDRREGRWARATVVALLSAFVVTHGQLGAAWGPWSLEEAARLSQIMVVSVASLSVFVAWRFSGP